MSNKMENKVKKKLTLQGVLSVLVIISIIRQFFLGNYQNMFMGVLALILFAVPVIIDKKMHVDIPPALEAIILLFVFSAQILGEVQAFYVKIPIWDTILHTTNGFLMAAIGFALVDILNRSEKFAIKMSPFFVAFVAFCFSMTTGVVWEFFEFGMDWFFGLDMQKDWILKTISSVKLDSAGGNVPLKVAVENMVVNGETWKLGGYLDIGIVDTMKDLIVNFIGAVVFSIVGYIYLLNEGKGKFANSLIPKMKSEEQVEEEEKQETLERQEKQERKEQRNKRI